MKTPGRALVTGANRGLGWWIGRELIARGRDVWGACRRPERAEELWALDPTGVVAYDAIEGDSGATSVYHALCGVGIESLDLLINNAGVKPAALRPDLATDGIEGLSSDVFTDVLRVNSVGPLALTRALLPLLRRASDGAVVVQLSSNLASHERVVGDDIGYCASKAALNMVAHLLGRDLVAEAITVVAMSPGWVRTDMGGEHAPLEPEPTMATFVDTLERLGPDRAGSFLDYAGDPINW